MAVVVSFLTTFGVHFAIILCILGFSYYFLNQRDPLEAEQPQSEERDRNNIPKDFSNNASGDDEVAPALPDDLQHVPYQGTVGQKILKSPGQKTREMKLINFTKKMFLDIFHFLKVCT